MARHADAPRPDRHRLAPALPGFAVLRRYRREWLRGDLPAGLTLWRRTRRGAPTTGVVRTPRDMVDAPCAMAVAFIHRYRVVG
ncbi:hypothetical protein ACWCXH_10485 [Kitasatospora sp. NPDC001660]